MKTYLQIFGKTGFSITKIMLIIIMLAGFGSQAQDYPKFGKITKREMQLDSIPEDPEADAVYLFASGDVSIFLDASDNRFKQKYIKHVRLKILTEKGKKYADISIPYWHEDKIRSLKAHTILPNGKKIKLKKKLISEDRKNNVKIKKFAMPGVVVGAIIEYKYQKDSKYVHELEPWYFQNSEFTLRSKYTVSLLNGFRFNAVFRNSPGIEPRIETTFVPGQSKEQKQYIWELSHLQPIREEPFMTTLEDYRIALHFQIVDYKDYYQYYKFIDTWEDLVKKSNEVYDKYLKPSKSLGKLAQNLAPDSLPKLEKVKVLYNYVCRKIHATSKGWIYPHNKPDKVVKESQGTGAEKNILFINLLRIAGISADPLIISTRSHGRIMENIPVLDQFNYVLAYVKIGLKSYVFDTRDKNCPYNLLPANNLVDLGMLISKNGEKKARFVKVPKPRGLNMLNCKTDAVLTEGGDLLARSVLRYDGYKAYKARAAIQKSEEKDFVTDLLNDRFGDAELDSFSIIGLENLEEPLVVELRYKVSQYAQTAGDMIYLEAPVLRKLKSNPLEREKRYFPVEFSYNSAARDEINLTLPDGYKVLETPHNTINRQKVFKLTFLNTWSNKNNVVKIQRQFMRQKELFPTKEYSVLRRFYDRVIAADQAQLVISQTTGKNQEQNDTGQ